MKKKIWAVFAVVSLCIFTCMPVMAAESEYEYYDELNDDSITIFEEGALQQINGISTRASSNPWYSWSLGKWNAEANSYTNSSKTTRLVIDRIYARYMNVKNGEIVKDIRDDQYDASHAAIGTKTIKWNSIIKGEFYFQKSGYETMKKTVQYN